MPPSRNKSKGATDYDRIKHLEAALRDAEMRAERYADALRHSPVWTWETDTSGKFVHLSDNIEHCAGQKAAYFVGKSRLELIGVSLSPERRAAHKKAIADRRSFANFVYPHAEANGRVKWYKTSGEPFFGENGEYHGYRGIAQDVTDDILLEQSAERARERLHSAIESLNDAFLLFDAEDKLVATNEAWRNLYGEISRAFTPGMTFEQIVRALVEAKLIDHTPISEEAFIADRLRAHENPGASYEVKRRDGGWHRVTEQLVPDGGIAVVISDISSDKKLERELRAAKEAAERASLAKSQFLASMSHELRTPLNATIGFSELILSELFGPIGNPRYKNYIEDIKNSGTHLLHIINDLLDLSKIDSQGFEPEPTDIDIDELIARCARMRADDIERSGKSLEINLPPDGIHGFRGDRRALNQIVINLLDNAIKFTGDDGKITLSADLNADDALEMSVKDNGIGIDPKDMPHIVDPFHRGQDPMVREREGAGLGLSVCNLLCRELGGSLSIESLPGVGTTVLVRIPPIAPHYAGT